MPAANPHRAALAALKSADWDAYLLKHSGLPGPRANLELVGVAADLGTAAQFKINPFVPEEAVPAAAQYLRQNLDRFGGDYDKALAAYNWGPGNVARYGMNAMPVETQNYIVKIRGADSSPMMLAGGRGNAPTPQDIPRPAVADIMLPTLPDVAMPNVPRPPPPGNALASLFFQAAKNVQPQEV